LFGVGGFGDSGGGASPTTAAASWSLSVRRGASRASGAAAESFRFFNSDDAPAPRPRVSFSMCVVSPDAAR
jgi:hypothetical protein